MTYPPSEDTFLLESVLKNETGSFLDVGTGSGYLAISYKKTHPDQIVWASDISKEALLEAQTRAEQLNITFIESDLFTNIKRKFDVIAFNPPYLSPDGGPPDNELIDNGSMKRYIEEVDRYLFKGGRAYILISSLSPQLDLTGWKRVARKKIFFEELFVYVKEKI